MSLLGRIERLEKTVGEGLEQSLEVSDEFREAMSRLLKEIRNRPPPTIYEQIAELRDRIKRNEAIEEPWKFLDEWSREELARLEAEVAKLQ